VARPSSQRIGAFTVTAPALYFNFASGNLSVPGVLSGYSADGNFRADRAFGNQRSGDLTLVGHVAVHKLGGVGKIGSPSEPVTLLCDRLQLQTKFKTYTAVGNVHLMQGNRSLEAPYMRLNDNTHDAELSGGVHAEQLPDRSFDAAQVFYNTRTQDFKALGGVRATFPLARPTP
jgi:lipopolysaccharide assembly outer membrane protein LptD (OstA)